MAGAKANAARFSIGRLGGDVRRVVTIRWAPLAGSMGVGVVAAILLSGAGFQRSMDEIDRLAAVFGAAAMVRTLVQIIVFSISATFVTSLAIGALAGEPLRRALAPGRLAFGFTTAMAMNALNNWANFALPIIAAAKGPFVASAWLAFGSVITRIPFAVLWTLAVPAAIGEGRPILGALWRSSRLLRGLRWLSFGLYLAYLLLAGAIRALLLTVFGAMPGGARLAVQGPGQAVTIAEFLVLASLFQIITAALFVQARRIADGPSVAEIEDVFA